MGLIIRQLRTWKRDFVEWNRLCGASAENACCYPGPFWAGFVPIFFLCCFPEDCVWAAVCRAHFSPSFRRQVDLVCLCGCNLVLSLPIYSLLWLFEQILPSLCVYLSPYVCFNKNVIIWNHWHCCLKILNSIIYCPVKWSIKDKTADTW